MKFTIVGYGTRGDVQPYLCLGAELAQRGQDVRICAPENLRGFVERLGGDDVADQTCSERRIKPKRIDLK